MRETTGVACIAPSPSAGHWPWLGNQRLEELTVPVHWLLCETERPRQSVRDRVVCALNVSQVCSELGYVI